MSKTMCYFCMNMYMSFTDLSDQFNSVHNFIARFAKKECRIVLCVHNTYTLHTTNMCLAAFHKVLNINVTC